MEREATHSCSRMGGPSRQSETHDSFVAFKEGSSHPFRPHRAKAPGPRAGWLIWSGNPAVLSGLSALSRIGGFASSSFDEYAHVTGGTMMPMSAGAIS